MNSIETNLKNYPFICHGDAYKTLTQTQFRDCSVIKESFEQGKKAFAAKNYKWAVNSFTQTIESLASNLSMVLMHRAAAFEMQQKYESAFNDGQRAIYNIANSSTLNIYSDTHHATLRDAFITTSNALIHQNLLKEAALQYRQAIEILPMVSPYFLELSLRHRQVTAEIANRNKWLNRYLPREVVFRIVSFLPLEDRGQLAMTCRFWYDLVLSQSSDMWRLMDVTDPKFPGKLASIQKLLRSVVPNRIGKVKLYLENKREDIRMVTEEDDNNSDISEANSTATTVESIPMVVDSDDENYEDDEKQCDYEQRSQLIYSAMFERNWNNIPEFEIINANQNQLHDVLQLNSKSVKHLKLINSSGDNESHEEALNVAVGICSNLVSITSQMNELAASTLRIAPTLPRYNLCLTTLELLCDMTTRSFAQLLQNTPSLTALMLDANKMRQYAETLNLINSHSPTLQMLSYKYQNLPNYSHLTTYTAPPPLQSSTSSMSTNGLQMLDFSILYHGTETDHEANDEALDTLLRNNCETLDYLKIGLREASIAKCQSLASLIRFGMPQLRRLLIDIPDFQLQHFGSRQLANLISACPSLEIVNIWRGCAIWHDRVLYALANLTRLDQLIISAEHVELICYEREERYQRQQNPDEGGLESAISDLGMEVLFTKAQTMTKFSFYAGDVDKDDDAFIMNLANMASFHKNIQELNIGFGEITNNQLAQVLERLEGSRMRVLKTDVNGEINDRVIRALAALSTSVEQLFIQDPFGDIRKSQLVRLLDRASYPFEVKIKIRQNSYMKGVKPAPGTAIMTMNSHQQQKLVISADDHDDENSYAKYSIQQYYDEDELHDLRCGTCGQISVMNNE